MNICFLGKITGKTVPCNHDCNLWGSYVNPPACLLTILLFHEIVSMTEYTKAQVEWSKQNKKLNESGAPDSKAEVV